MKNIIRCIIVLICTNVHSGDKTFLSLAKERILFNKANMTIAQHLIYAGTAKQKTQHIYKNNFKVYVVNAKRAHPYILYQNPQEMHYLLLPKSQLEQLSEKYELLEYVQEKASKCDIYLRNHAQ